MSSPPPNNQDLTEANDLVGKKRKLYEQPIYDSLKRKALPRNAQCISVILKSFGITDVEPNVIYQLQEFAHRYTTDILSDAQVFSEHCGRSTINKSDILESISSRLHHSFSGPPNQEFLRELANKTNSKPLPIIHEKFGTRLPKEKYCLTATNFQILPDVIGTTGKEKEDRMGYMAAMKEKEKERDMGLADLEMVDKTVNEVIEQQNRSEKEKELAEVAVKKEELERLHSVEGAEHEEDVFEEVE